MSDATTTKLDKPATPPETSANPNLYADMPPGVKADTSAATNESLVKAGTLPPLSIDGSDTKNTNAPSGTLAVAKDLGQGAWNEITQHPGQVAESAVAGLAIGAVAAALGPEVAIGAAAAGAAYAGYELYEHAGSWLGAAKTVANQKDYSQDQVAQANTELQQVGAGGVLVAAGTAGAFGGNLLAGSLAAAADAPAVAAGDAPAAVVPAAVTPPAEVPVTPTPAAPTLPTDAPATPAQPAVIPTGDSPATPAQPAVIPTGDSPAAPAQPAASLPGDSSNTPAPSGDAPAKAAELTPEQQALADSIKGNQAIFSAAGKDGSLITAGKQDYNVRFQKVTEPTQVQSLESMKTGSTETAQPGQWIATRLNPDGTPNIEDGIENSWPIAEKNVLKSYKATPEDLQSNQFVAGTRTDAPPVQMVKLTAPLTMMTNWGTKLGGNAGDYLANYNYDATTGTPGDDFNIVTATSYKQTYQPV